GWSLSPSGSRVHERGGLLSCTTWVEVWPPRPRRVRPSFCGSKLIARGVARPGTEPPPTGQVLRPPARPTRKTSPYFTSGRPRRQGPKELLVRHAVGGRAPGPVGLEYVVAELLLPQQVGHRTGGVGVGPAVPADDEVVDAGRLRVRAHLGSRLLPRLNEAV